MPKRDELVSLLRKMFAEDTSEDELSAIEEQLARTYGPMVLDTIYYGATVDPDELADAILRSTTPPILITPPPK